MKTVVIGSGKLSIEDVVAIAKKQVAVELDSSAEFQRKIDSGAEFLDEALAEHGGIYGVTTGYGDSCTQVLPPEHYSQLPINLTRFHGCGLGDYFDAETTRAIMAVRLNTLSQGFSGVSYALLKIITQFLQNDILPLIPQEGSVGASGDLTPLSYLAGAVIGERNVMYKGERRSSLEVMKELGITPHKFRPKEAIAIMNGTAAMNAVACMAYSRAEYLSDLACRITAMITVAMKGNAYHYYERLFEAKPHPGLGFAAKKIREALNLDVAKNVVPEKIQDPYSLRCAPHVIGLFYDSSAFLRQLIEIELNSANDNPIVDPFTKNIFHGGHFYGGHICLAMDTLKNMVANIADLLDRQLAMIVDIKFNRNLPPNLAGSKGNYDINHGFKAVQIGVSAWTAEALHLTMPMSVFSRSTECHNQDKVSMGTIAARDCIRVLELSEQVAAATLLASAQALRIRLERGEISEDRLKNLQETYNQVFSKFAPLECDRQLEQDLRNTLELIRQKFYAV